MRVGGALSFAGRNRALLVAVVSEGRRRKASPKRGSRGAEGVLTGRGPFATSGEED